MGPWLWIRQQEGKTSDICKRQNDNSNNNKKKSTLQSAGVLVSIPTSIQEIERTIILFYKVTSSAFKTFSYVILQGSPRPIYIISTLI